MKINFNSNIPRPTPSSSYHETQARFKSILENKLGVKNTSFNSQNINSSNRYTNGSFSSENVKLLSGASPEDIDSKLKGTELEGLGNDFANAERRYGINAWFLTGLAIHESGFGTSRIARDKNNLFGFTAYDGSPYESATSFSSKGESVDRTARYLSEHYLNPNGKYYNGLSVEAIGKRYATDPNWSGAINSRINSLLQED